MQSAEAADELGTRTQGQVVGVAEDDARPERLEIVGRQRLDGGLGADRHEDRGLDLAVRGLEASGPRVPVARQDRKGAHGSVPRMNIASP